MSPTQRTLREQRNLGRRCQIVEKFNPHVGPHGIRQDLFGIIDVLSLDPEHGFVGVQSTGSAFSQHFRKLTEDRAQECLDWMNAGGRLELWGWRKIKAKRGGKAKIWRPRIHIFTEQDFT